MKIQRTLIALFLEIALVLSNVMTVYAAGGPPTIPSSFWGTAFVDGVSVPNGIVVQALIGGQVFAETLTSDYGEETVYYMLDVPNDDPGTPAKEGGVNGETIQFKIGGLTAAQTGVFDWGTNQPINLTAVNMYELSISKLGTGSGTVISDPSGINCGTDCSESYEYDTLVVLTATAAPGSTFDGWDGACSGTDPCTVTMDAAQSVTAEFTQDEYTLTITSHHGTVAKAPDQETYTYGQEVELTAMPVAGWSFSNWSGDISSTANPVTVTMNGNKAVTAHYTENPTPVTVTVDSGQGKVFGADDPVFTYTSSVSGVTFTGALSRVAGENVGTYAITQGTLAAVGNYVITFVPANFSITPKPITVTADAKSKAYGATDPALTYTSSDNGVIFTGALTRDPGENVGSYAIRQGSLTAGSNYSITFVSANLTVTPKGVTVTADAKTKVFGAVDPAFTYTSSVSGLTFTGALDREMGENVGTYAITQGSLTAGSNYSITFVSADLTITAKPITVTAAARSKVYGSTDPVFTYTSSDNGATFTGDLTRDPGENVGSYAIHQGSLTAGSNYSITFVSANLTITAKPITVTADSGQSKVFGAVDPVLTYTSSDSSATFTGALTRATGENVGTYAITRGSLTAGSNYSINFVSANFVIAPMGVTVTADAKTKVFGSADPVFTYTSSVSGLIFTGALSRVAGQNVGTYTITQNTLTAGSNYAITFVSADLTITPKPITVTANSGQSKVYGADDPTFTYTSSDSGATFTGALSRETGENVGTYAITQGSLAANSNYTMMFASANFSITPKPITVTADAKTKVYGAVDPTFTYTSSDNGATFTGALSREAGENVGAYAITRGALAVNSNYTMTFVSANLTITPKPITVTADAKTKVYGAVDPAFTYTSSESGLTFTGTLSRVAGENVGTYAITKGSLAVGSNYTINFVSADLTITPKPITVTADAKTKVYGAADPAFTYTSSDNGATFTGALGRDAGENVGTYAITRSTLGVNGNYTMTFVSANLTITPAALTITADDKTKTQGAANPALTASYNGFVNGDDASDLDTPVMLSTSADASSSVGTYTIATSSAADANYAITFINGTLRITPAAFGLTSPANAATDQPTSLTLLWQASAGADGYEYCYDKTGNNSCDGTWLSADTNVSANISDLNEGTTYFWMVRATHPAGATYANSGTWWSFSTIPSSNPAFNKTSPANGVTGQPIKPTLTWEASAGAESYEYCYDTTNDNACSTWTSVVTTSKALEGLAPSTTYYWQVRAIRGATTTYANDLSTAFWSFMTSPAPGAFNKTAPANKAVKQPIGPTLTWGASTNATSYEYCYDTSNDTTCDSEWTRVDTTSVSLSGLTHNGTYYWQVRAVGLGGYTYANTGAWFNFKVIIDAPVLTDPLDAAFIHTRRPSFEWEDVQGATNYTIEASLVPNFAAKAFTVTVTPSNYTRTADLAANTLYYWRVKANGTNGPSAYSDVRTFTTGGAVPVPVLVSPVTNALFTTSTVKLDWKDVVMPAGTFGHYQIQLATNAYFTAGVFEADADISEYIFTVTPNTRYYWRVRTYNNLNDYGVWSASRIFRAAMLPPVSLEPGNVVPGTADSVHTRRPTYKWEAVDGATSYTVQASTYSNFLIPAMNVTTLGTSYTYTADLAANKVYYWRVKANGLNGPSAYSDVRTFTTGTPPSIPVLKSPASNVLLNSTTVLFDWGNSTVAAGASPVHHYQIQVATNISFSSGSIVVEENTTPADVNDSDYTSIAELSSGGTYYWRVRSWNAAGDFSAWSLVRSVRIRYLAPALLLPAPTATSVSRMPTFDWNDTTGATSYNLQVSTSATFLSLAVNKTVTASTYSQPANLLANKTYYWRVRVNGPNGPSEWSPSFSFTTTP